MITQTNHFCVPTALAILTDLPVDAVEKILKDVYLGDVEISGIYIGLALKFLSDNGFKWEHTIMGGTKLSHYSCQSPHLIEILGHALVLKDGKIFDNAYLNGVDIGQYPRRNDKILRAYRISKDAS